MRPGERLALLLLDLDKFEIVRDLCGPAGADAVLDIVAQDRLRPAPPMRALHFTADTFIYLLPFTNEREDIAAFAQQVKDRVSKPIWIGRNVVHLTMSIGIAIDEEGLASADDLLHAASIALSHAREFGEGSIRFFEQHMLAELDQRAELEYDFRSGLIRSEVQPYYQPIVSLPGEIPHGFEALARWQHPRHGLISPGSFLPIAHELGLDRELFILMMRQACRDARDWPAHLTISVNMSPSQLCDPTIASETLKILYASGFNPTRLIFEITEEALIDNVARACETIRLLRSAGIRIAVDDFGSGYSSLQRLCALEVDQLKIDSTLVQSMGHEAGRKLLKAVVDMGHALAMAVTAEGIETREQALFMTSVNCAYGQGYLFGHPEPAAVAQAIAERS
jgi:diguanylate cyclase (GGDEF)-like protein